MRAFKWTSSLGLILSLAGQIALADLFDDAQLAPEAGEVFTEVYEGRDTSGLMGIKCRLAVLRESSTGNILRVKAVSYAKQVPIIIALEQARSGEIEGTTIYQNTSTHTVRVLLENGGPVSYVYTQVNNSHPQWPIQKRCVALELISVKT